MQVITSNTTGPRETSVCIYEPCEVNEVLPEATTTDDGVVDVSYFKTQRTPDHLEVHHGHDDREEERATGGGAGLQLGHAYVILQVVRVVLNWILETNN